MNMKPFFMFINQEFSRKPQQIGGTEGREMQQPGVALYCQGSLQNLNVDPAGKFAIQGFGNAGQRAALLHHELLGAGKLIAVSDSRGAIYNPDGFNSTELVQHKLKTGSNH